MERMWLLLCSLVSSAMAQQLAPLTVEKIMRDQKWMGTSPSDFRWSADSKKLFFHWDPDRTGNPELYQISPPAVKPVKAVQLRAEKAEKATSRTSENFIYDQVKDTVYRTPTAQIPGIKDLPAYLKDYPGKLEERKQKNADRTAALSGPYWNEEGTAAVMFARAQDNKDLWLLKIDGGSSALSLLDPQHDEAWVGGSGSGTVGWLDADRVYYRSEASGYAHIYLSNIKRVKKQLTSGNWEVQQLQLSRDKKTFYFTANKAHPGITHFYKLGVNGGMCSRLLR